MIRARRQGEQTGHKDRKEETWQHSGRGACTKAVLSDPSEEFRR